MAETHHELTPSLKRALERWFEDYPQHIQEMAPIRRFVEENIRKSVEEKEREVRQQERRNAIIQAKREDLILLLESKFGPLSGEIISRLEALRDVDELTQLYKKTLDAQTLEDVGIPKVKNT